MPLARLTPSLMARRNTSKSAAFVEVSEVEPELPEGRLEPEPEVEPELPEGRLELEPEVEPELPEGIMELSRCVLIRRGMRLITSTSIKKGVQDHDIQFCNQASSSLTYPESGSVISPLRIRRCRSLSRSKSRRCSKRISL